MSDIKHSAAFVVFFLIKKYFCLFVILKGTLNFNTESGYLEEKTWCHLLSFPKLNIYSLGVSKHMLVKQVTHFPNGFVAMMLGNLDQSTYLINSLQDQSSAYA